VPFQSSNPFLTWWTWSYDSVFAVVPSRGRHGSLNMRFESCRALRTTTIPLRSYRSSSRQHHRLTPFLRRSGTRGPDRPTRRQIDITDADLVVAAAEPFRCRCACPAAVAASFGDIVLFMFFLLLAVPRLLVTLL